MKNFRFKSKQKLSSINIYKSDKDSKNLLIKKISQEISKLDQRIYEESNELFQTHITGFRARFAAKNNWFQKMYSNLYWSKIQNSAKWQQYQIKQLYQEKRKLKLKLDKLSGKFWIKRFHEWLWIAFLYLIFSMTIWIMLMGIITSLYFLPIWGSILIAYALFDTKSKNNF